VRQKKKRESFNNARHRKEQTSTGALCSQVVVYGHDTGVY